MATVTCFKTEVEMVIKLIPVMCCIDLQLQRLTIEIPGSIVIVSQGLPVIEIDFKSKHSRTWMFLIL